MLKRLVILISVVVGGTIYLLLHSLMVGAIWPKMQEPWGWTVTLAIFGTPVALTVVLGFIHALISWIVWGELIAPEEWLSMIKNRIHREPRASYLYIENITDAEKDVRDALKELDAEYPGMEG